MSNTANLSQSIQTNQAPQLSVVQKEQTNYQDTVRFKLLKALVWAYWGACSGPTTRLAKEVVCLQYGRGALNEIYRSAEFRARDLENIAIGKNLEACREYDHTDPERWAAEEEADQAFLTEKEDLTQKLMDEAGLTKDCTEFDKSCLEWLEEVKAKLLQDQPNAIDLDFLTFPVFGARGYWFLAELIHFSPKKRFKAGKVFSHVFGEMELKQVEALILDPKKDWMDKWIDPEFAYNEDEEQYINRELNRLFSDALEFCPFDPIHSPSKNVGLAKAHLELEKVFDLKSNLADLNKERDRVLAELADLDQKKQDLELEIKNQWEFGNELMRLELNQINTDLIEDLGEESEWQGLPF